MVNTFVIKSQKLAGYLMMKGFKLHAIEKGRKDESRNVFFFTNSDELQNVILEYKQVSGRGGINFV